MGNKIQRVKHEISLNICMLSSQGMLTQMLWMLPLHEVAFVDILGDEHQGSFKRVIWEKKSPLAG